ncbi:MAG: hypothetical protein ACRET4_19060 [Steroidobacteraceae bacterium]
MVQELRQLSPDEARERFTRYLQGLSSTARAGFALTLASLASNERNEQARRFIESLRAALENPHAWSPATTNAPAPAPDKLSSFDDDLQRVCDWRELGGDDRDEAIASHLQSLDVDGLEQLHANLKRMQENCASNIQNHRENEARIVAGRFVEDQINYRMSVQRTGQHDPDWVRRLRDLEGWAHWFDALHNVVGAVIEQRRNPPEPAPAPVPSAELSELDGLRQFLEESIKSGEVRGERAVAFRRMLDKMDTILQATGRGEMGKEEAIHRIKQLYADMAPHMADPGSKARTASGSGRLKEVDAYAGDIKTAVARELMEGPPAATSEALGAVLGDLGRFQQEVAAGPDDEALAQLEAELLRPAARARHELAMTRHALIARPLWESVEYLPAVNALFYSGAADLQEQVEVLAAPKRLYVLNTKRLQNYGQVRWDSLNSCHVALFDLRGAQEIATVAARQPERARELAAAAYELGLAFALGKPVIVVAGTGEQMPFDIDLASVALEGYDEDAALLAQAIDEAFYVPQRSGRSASLSDSLAFFDRLTASHEKRASFEGMGWLDQRLSSDPAGFVANSEQMIRQLPPPPWRVLRPAWPGAYPDAKNRRCFHVMPFGPEWADEVRDVARAACKKRDLVYRRGDEAEEGRIIHAIWEDLCRATVVLVELTGANLNVMIELGIAHAIGRPVLAVQRRDAVDLRPKHIEKLRVFSYETASDLRELLLTKLPA